MRRASKLAVLGLVLGLSVAGLQLGVGTVEAASMRASAWEAGRGILIDGATVVTMDDRHTVKIISYILRT